MALPDKQRWLYGALGAVAPIVAAGVSIDGHAIQNFFADPVNMVGFGFRTVCLLIIGGFVSFLHRRTEDEWNAFVIGIGAPAMIMTMIANGSGVTNSAAIDNRGGNSYAQHQPLRFVSEANAAEIPPARLAASTSVPFFPLCMPRRSTAIRFLNGVFGNFAQPLDLYWLASAPIDDKQAAVAAYQAYLAGAQAAGMTPRIFSISGKGREQYVLVLAINLSAKNAEATDPRLWRLSNRPVAVAPISMNGLLKRLGVLPASLDICHFLNDPPKQIP